MTFEKEFPSLKDKIDTYDYDRTQLPRYFVWCESVQEFCLDKQRVREAIEKHFICVQDCSITGNVNPACCEELLKELGL